MLIGPQEQGGGLAWDVICAAGGAYVLRHSGGGMHFAISTQNPLPQNITPVSDHPIAHVSLVRLGRWLQQATSQL